MTCKAMLATARAAALGSVFLLAGGGAASEDPALHVRYGDPAVSLSAEIDAMAGTGAALYRGGFSNVLNPACLALGEDWRADAALALVQVHEDRFVPLFDTFGSYVTDTAIASNRHHHFGAGFALAKRLPVAWRPVTVALSLTDRYSFVYDFSETVRDPDSFATYRDAVLQDRAVEIDGALRALSGGAGIQLSDRLALGLAAHYAFGTRAQVTRVRDYDVPANSIFEDASFEMGGLNFTLGAHVRASERLELGLTYETPLAATGDTRVETVYGAYPDSVRVVDGTAGVDYPRAWRAGLVYRPRATPRTVFAVDAAFTEWSDLEDSRLSGDNPLGLDEAWDVRAGLEHRFYNDTTARFGFRRLDSYDDRETGASFFTAGVGFPAAGGSVDVSATLSKITSVRDHWFTYPVDFVVDSQARVEDTRFGLGVGYSRVF